MTIISFETILEELGRVLNIPGLKADDNRSCALKIEGNIQILLEMKDDYLQVGTDFGELPLDRYREDLFEAALKSNSHSSPLYGIFAYSAPLRHFIMFEHLHGDNLRGEFVAEFIYKFVEKAKIWKDALEHSEVPVVSDITTSDHLGIFGLIH